MPKCIYCNEREATSDEHAIPSCLGMDKDKIINLEYLKNKLCSVCNEKIGKLEEQFCRCSPEALFRRIKGIEGRKHHKKVNPFYRGSSGGGHIEATTKHPSKDYIIKWDLLEGSTDFEPARQIIVQDNKGKYYPIRITDNIQTFDDLNKILQSKGLVDCKPVESYATPEEIEWIDRICKGFKESFEWNELSFMPSEKEKEFVVKFVITEKYFRAIAKIAFHYFLQHFTQFSGFEKEFEGIKHFIMNGGKVKTWVKQVQGSFIYDLQSPHITIDKYAHFIVAEKLSSHIVAKMIFFVGPIGNPSSYFQVMIGRNPGRIYYPQSVGHQVVYFDQEDANGYIGIMQKIRKFPRNLLI